MKAVRAKVFGRRSVEKEKRHWSGIIHGFIHHIPVHGRCLKDIFRLVRNEDVEREMHCVKEMYLTN